jgi:hypothetical protein
MTTKLFFICLLFAVLCARYPDLLLTIVLKQLFLWILLIII